MHAATTNYESVAADEPTRFPRQTYGMPLLPTLNQTDLSPPVYTRTVSKNRRIN